MAIINTYGNDTTIHAEDKLLGSDGTTGADAGVTKNYTVGDLGTWIGESGLYGDVVVGDLTTNGAVITKINVITATPGGVTEVLRENHFNVITYSGANGTHTLNLPVSERGLILRFKTDETISNAMDVLIQGAGGQTIDGAASYTMDRAYDGITLLGHNDQWLVIQRKSK